MTTEIVQNENITFCIQNGYVGIFAHTKHAFIYLPITDVGSNWVLSNFKSKPDQTLIEKTIESASIRHWSDTFATSRCQNDIDPFVSAIKGCVLRNDE